MSFSQCELRSVSDQERNNFLSLRYMMLNNTIIKHSYGFSGISYAMGTIEFSPYVAGLHSVCYSKNNESGDNDGIHLYLIMCVEHLGYDSFM